MDYPFYHWYRVRNSHTNQTIHVSEDFMESCHWMMHHAHSFIFLERNVYERDCYGVEELNCDGECVGWWTLDDLLDENPDGWVLDGGRIKVKWKDENKDDVIAMYTEENEYTRG